MVIEMNEVLEKLPPHLLRYAIDQPYNEYTAEDHAIWRYVMRLNVDYLPKVAHSSYLDGLKKTGITVDRIPTMYGMNRILQEIGWAAVNVDGFIPPAAFMEFQTYNVLVIAADIRTLDHIEYTPAPDIIHEAAGHAPIIANEEYANYLRRIGLAGARAFASQRDYELFEAIRHLSIVKEDPYHTQEEVAIAEAAIEHVQANMGPPSEMARVRNLHWWSVEYGLIGDLKDYRIYGAGLLSSIGESYSCMSPRLPKLPFSTKAADQNFEITKPQPQLFVAESFAHLNHVLDEFMEGMALTRGGSYALECAVNSGFIATMEFSNGLQVTSKFTRALSDLNDNLVAFEVQEGIVFYERGEEIAFSPKERSPLIRQNSEIYVLGPIEGYDRDLKSLNRDERRRLGWELGKQIKIKYRSGWHLEGRLVQVVYGANQTPLLLGLEDHRLVDPSGIPLSTSKGQVYWAPLGERIVSGFSGPVKHGVFSEELSPPKEKTRKVDHTEERKRSFNLFEKVRVLRGKRRQGDVEDLADPRPTTNNMKDISVLSLKSDGVKELEDIWKSLVELRPDDWLLSLEILELLEDMNTAQNDLSSKWSVELKEKIRIHLGNLRTDRNDLRKLIDDGLRLIHRS